MNARHPSSPRLFAPVQPRSLRRDICCSTSDGTAYSLMLGMGENYLPAFVLALGLGQVYSGLIATLPMLAGALLQLVTPLCVRRMGSYRSWVVLCATVQTLNFFVLGTLAAFDAAPAWVVFVAATAYWATGLACGPAWSTWISLLIPSRIRARYFASRNRYCQAGVLVGLLAAGWILSLCAGPGYSARLVEDQDASLGDLDQGILRGFAIIFVLAGACRGVCTIFLAFQSEPRPLPHPHTPVSVRQLFARTRTATDGKLLAYAASMAVAAQIAQPFFNPYMRTQLGLGEDRCAVLLAAGFLGRIIALPWIGRLAHRHGGFRVLVVGGLAMVPAAGLWVVTGNLVYLIATQLFVGAAWAAHEMGVFLLTLESIPEAERTSVLTKYNVLNAFSMSAGSVIGGWLLEAQNKTLAAYMAVFLASTLARALTLVLMVRLKDPGVPAPDLLLESLSIRPGDGTVDQPVLASIDPNLKPPAR